MILAHVVAVSQFHAADFRFLCAQIYILVSSSKTKTVGVVLNLFY